MFNLMPNTSLLSRIMEVASKTLVPLGMINSLDSNSCSDECSFGCSQVVVSSMFNGACVFSCGVKSLCNLFELSLLP
jgi:hypothetical protein